MPRCERVLTGVAWVLSVLHNPVPRLSWAVSDIIRPRGTLSVSQLKGGVLLGRAKTDLSVNNGPRGPYSPCLSALFVNNSSFRPFLTYARKDPSLLETPVKSAICHTQACTWRCYRAVHGGGFTPTRAGTAYKQC